MRKIYRSYAGFTMIELMITVVIIGIVAAMAVPRFGKAYERMTFRSKNREITSMLRLARSKAITDKEIYGVHFNPDLRLITLFKKDPASVNYDTYEPGDSVVQVDTMTYELDFVATDLTTNALSFRPNGSSIFTGGGNIVTMRDNEDIVGIYHLNILASTGRIQSEGYYY